MQLHPSQSIVAKDKHRFRVVNCGRRFGKTTLAAWEMIGFGVAYPNARIPYYAPTRDDARDIMWKMLQDIAKDLIVDLNEGRLELTIRNNCGGTSQLLLYGWEAVQERKKGVGVKNNFIVLDEVSKYRNFWMGWQEVLRPTLTDLRGEAMFVSTPSGFNHFYDLFGMEAKDTDYKSFHFTSYDNPFLPVGELDKTKVELTEDRFAQEIMADFRKTEGLVYKEFDREQHIYSDADVEADPINRIKLFGGVDFGFTNPCAVLSIEKDNDVRYFITSEWYKTQQTDAQIADYVAALKWNECYPDPESASGIEELKRRGINVREVIKNKDSIRNGINTIRELFKSNRLYIHESCQNLIWELETYSYPDRKSMHNEDENPIKENDHACFIAGTNADGYDIEKVGVQTGVKDVYEYEIGGEKITATVNHPVYTHRGLVNMDALRYDDVIWKNKASFMQVSGGQDIQTVLQGLKGFIFSVPKRLMEARERDYIDLYGKKQTELFQMDTVFIILTAIPTIIHWIILLVFSAVNTLRIIGLKKIGKGLEHGKISKMLLHRLPSGQKLQLVNRGDVRLENPVHTFYLKENQLQESAIYVEKNIQQKGMGEIDSAMSIAVQKHFVGRVPVYNLKTKSGMYLANGLLVSNCDAARYALSMEQTIVSSGSVVIHRPAVAGFARMRN